MNYVFRSADNPEADGRQVKIGEKQFVLSLPLEDKGKLKIFLGEQGFMKLYATLSCMMDDEPFLKKKALKLASEIVAGGTN